MRRTFEMGQVAMGLEVVSLIRTLESLPVVSDAEREGTIATLYTLLREQDLEDVFDLYERLNEWRQVKFDSSGRVNASARERPTSASVDVPSPAHLRELSVWTASRSAVPRRTLTPADRLRVLTLVRQSPEQDASAIGEQMELPLEGEQETLFE